MAVYVDDMFAPYGDMQMCHMIADTHDELIEMVDRIGVQRKWIQNEGTWREHFDISKGKRKLAISMGALPVSQRELARRRREKGGRIAVARLRELIPKKDRMIFETLLPRRDDDV